MGCVGVKDLVARHKKDNFELLVAHRKQLLDLWLYKCPILPKCLCILHLYNNMYNIKHQGLELGIYNLKY